VHTIISNKQYRRIAARLESGPEVTAPGATWPTFVHRYWVVSGTDGTFAPRPSTPIRHLTPPQITAANVSPEILHVAPVPFLVLLEYCVTMTLEHWQLSAIYRVGQKSKLLILSKYVNKTEKIGEM